VRGHQVDGDTVAIYKPADKDIAYSVGNWQPGATCTMQGLLFQKDHLEVSANFKGTLVNQPPSADAGPDRTVECNATGRGFFTLDGGVHDPDNNIASIGWFRGGRKGPLVGMLPTLEADQPVSTPASNNMTQYVLKVLDALGQYDEHSTTVDVVDTTAPDLTVTLSPTVLWPPNHKLVPITATITVQDICDPDPTVQLISITSSEPANGLGDGNTSVDIQDASLGTDDRQFLLRAERSGSGAGRVYTITYKATDHSGNSTTRTATVTVPKSQGAR